MHRIDTAGSESGAFVDYDAVLGKPGTKVDAAIMNAIQEEIASFIVGQGIALVKGTNTQLLAALVKWLQEVQHTFKSAQTIQDVLLDMYGDARLKWRAVSSGAVGDANPPASEEIKNEIRAANVCKAWGVISVVSGVGSVVDGFNVASTVGVGAASVIVNLAGDMDDANYSVVVTPDFVNRFFPIVVDKVAGSFGVECETGFGALDHLNPQNSNVKFSFVVFGKQTT